MKRHYEPPVLLYDSGFPGWLAWFSLHMFCLNNKIHFSLANANNNASFKWKKAESRFRQQKWKTNLQTEEKCRINGACREQDCSQAYSVGYKTSDATSRAACCALL